MSRRDRKKRRTRERVEKPELKNVSPEELKAIVARARDGEALSNEDWAKLDAAIDTLVFVAGELDSRNVTVARLRHLFGLSPSEKTRTVVGDHAKATEPGAESTKPETLWPVVSITWL